MKLIEKNIEWLVVIAVVLITTIAFTKSLMATLEIRIVIGLLKYFTLLILFLIFLYQKHTYGIKIYDTLFFTFYIVYCVYLLVDMTILLRYPLKNMLAVPDSLFDYIIGFAQSIGFLLCAKTIVSHFNVKKYVLLSVIICTIPSVWYIQTVGLDTIQTGISRDDEEFISSLSVTYANMPIMVFAILYFKRLFNRKLFSMILCSCIIAAVLYILFAYGKRGPMLWSFVGVFCCYMIKSKFLLINKKFIFLILVIATFITYMDPILNVIKDALPKTGKKLEVTLKEGDTSGRFDINDAKHSTYLVGLENFSRSPVWGYYFRLVTNYVHYQGAYAHNIFIEILMTMGLLGFIPFMMLLFKAYRKSRTIIKRSNSPNHMACFILFICAFLQLQTTGTCVFKYNFWVFFYVLCCLEKFGSKVSFSTRLKLCNTSKLRTLYFNLKDKSNNYSTII